MILLISSLNLATSGFEIKSWFSPLSLSRESLSSYLNSIFLHYNYFKSKLSTVKDLIISCFWFYPEGVTGILPKFRTSNLEDLLLDLDGNWFGVWTKLAKLLSNWIWIDRLRFPLRLEPIEIFNSFLLNGDWVCCLSLSSGISSI